MVLKMSQVTLCLCCVFLLFCDLVVFHGFLSYSLVLQRFSSPQVLSLCLPCVPCVLASMFVYFLFYFDSPLRQCILFCFLTVSSRLIMFSCVPCLCVFSSVPCQFVCVSSVFPCLSFLVPGFCMFSMFLMLFWLASPSLGFVSVFQFLPSFIALKYLPPNKGSFSV